MIKKILIVSCVVFCIRAHGKTRKRVEPSRDCQPVAAADCPAWIHDWYFYWPYQYYGYHHPYYWHDGFHISLGS